MVGLPRRLAAVSLTLAAALVASSAAEAQIADAFTYQGRLGDAGAPANGVYDLQFKLFNAPTAGTQVGSTVVFNDMAVVNGLFTVRLAFFPVFQPFIGTQYLQIEVRPGASTGVHTVLPRQELTAALYATYAVRAGLSEEAFAVSWARITSMPAGFADGTDNDSGGDITQVTAGTGLTGGGTTGAVTLAASFAGTGVAPFASRSDHDHFGASWSGSTNNQGLFVTNNAPGTAVAPTAVHGRLQFQQGSGVYGDAVSSVGTAVGVTGSSVATGGIGVEGSSPNVGVAGRATGSASIGVRGITTGTSGSAAGVYGNAQATVSGGATGVWGVQGPAAGSYAGYFSGRAHVNGTLSKSAGSFKIDHPLDPENRYLSHSFVESPDMMNVYNGNLVLDAEGRGEVVLPEWFEALNKDFRYQLTPIGAPGPALHVAREIAGNRFAVGGGSPGLKVSWQVTGIRRDAYAERNRIPVEEWKPQHERGVYLQPEAHGLPAERGLDFRRRPRDLPSATRAEGSNE